MARVGSQRSGRSFSRRGKWVFLAVALCASAAVAILARRGSGPAGGDPGGEPGRGATETSGAPGAADAKAQADERFLREEQAASARELAAAYPKSDDAAHLLGLVYREQGNIQDAVKCWRKALELDSSRADSNECLAMEALIREDYAESEALYRRALDLDPRTRGAVEGLGRALLNQGKEEEAAALISRLPFPDPDTLILLGEAYRKLGEFAKATKPFEGALRARPEDPDALYGLAMALKGLGEKEKARQTMEAFSKVRETRHDSARIWRKAFDPKSVTVESVAHTHTDVGRVYRSQGDEKKAEEMWLRAAALDRANAVARMELTTLYLQKGREAEALKRLEELAAILPSDPEVFLRLGTLYARAGRRAEAARALGRAKELAPKNPRVRQAFEALQREP